ncbi:hypothetical protein [Kitasatospora sp. NPDC057015]|uniref:hypothetical protein n=1 Tax=Kitasatospora sp. NPDC057015 TaxID=3346001 RepID=UPI00363549D1
MIHELGSAEAERVGKSMEGFGNFLRRNAYDIRVSVSGLLRNVRQAVCGWFD